VAPHAFSVFSTNVLELFLTYTSVYSFQLDVTPASKEFAKGRAPSRVPPHANSSSRTTLFQAHFTCMTRIVSFFSFPDSPPPRISRTESHLIRQCPLYSALLTSFVDDYGKAPDPLQKPLLEVFRFFFPLPPPFICLSVDH